MNVSRREFVLLTAVAGAGAAVGIATPRALARLAQSAPAEAPVAAKVFDWRPVGVGDAVHAAFGHGGNTMVVASGGQSLLIDCKLTGMGDALRREAESFAPLRRVVNTHHHADHTGGNSAFVRDLPVLAHEKCGPRVAGQLERYVRELRAGVSRLGPDADPTLRRALEEAKGLLDRVDSLKAEDFVPTEAMGGERSIRVGGVAVELRHIGPGHTDNDVFVFLPEQNILHTGDLLFHGLNPFVDAASGADTRGWQTSIGAMLKVCNDATIVVPGHGEITDAAGLMAQSEYFDKVRDAVAAAIKEGKTKEQVQAMVVPAFEGLGFEQVRGRVLGVVFDELTRQ